MRKSILIILSLFFFNSNIRAQDSLKTIFRKEYREYNIDTSLKIAVPFNHQFYCLKSNCSVFILNTATGIIDSCYKDNSKEINLQNLYLRNDTLFGVSKTDTYYLNEKKYWQALNKSFSVPPIFEDENYVVASTCSGEWGGTVYFKDKKTNKIYASQATCVVNVKKINNKYNITASLAHLRGFSNIFDVEDPKLLDRYKTKRVIGKIMYVGYNEAKTSKGTIQLIDSVGIETASSFVYNSHVFYLVSKHDKTFITAIQNNKFKILDELVDFSIWSYYPINRNYGDETIYSFNNDETSGFIAIAGNKLNFYSFNWRHK